MQDRDNYKLMESGAHTRQVSDFPENIQEFALSETNEFDKSLRSSLARINEQPLRVTTRAEEI